MIFYFSGAGNSKWVADQLANNFSDKLFQIGEYERKNKPLTPFFDIHPDEKIGFVFPVHSWGMPPIVAQFIADLQLNGYKNQLIYCVMTCGDECGLTKQHFIKALADKKLDSYHIYSVVMPNTYICMKGFGIDSIEVQEKKKKQAAIDLPKIIEAIKKNKPIYFYKGSKNFARIKSGVIYNLFAKHSLSDKKFTCSNACIACGKCVTVCPVDNIALKDDKPIWNGDCTQCLACIHHCPTKAIEYGNATKNQGRYVFK